MAVRNLIRPRSGIKYKDLVIVAVIKMISLSKLIDGGAAILVAVNKNHHILIMGLIVIKPLVRNILRVLVIS